MLCINRNCEVIVNEKNSSLLPVPKRNGPHSEAPRGAGRRERREHLWVKAFHGCWPGRGEARYRFMIWKLASFKGRCQGTGTGVTEEKMAVAGHVRAWKGGGRG